MFGWWTRAVGLGAVLLFGAGTQVPVDLGGRPIAQLARDGTRVVVLFFAASDCPISNRYVPEVQRLAKDFAGRGVTVWFVYPNPGDTAAVVRAHNAAYGLADATAALDVGQTLVTMAHATITPEAAVFIPDGAGLREVYRGRVDDRYIAFGQERPRALHHDLEKAIQAVLEGKPAPAAGGPPVGCSIVTTSLAAGATGIR
jgi:hypothetical protein